MTSEKRNRNQDPRGEPVWTYRGYELKGSEFTTAMVHLFRAEVNRANVWRQRLDTTTNWAVVATGAFISLAFTELQIGHIVVMLNFFLVTIFLMIEARRYRYYELWSSRVRLMETDFFAAMLVPPFHPSPDWGEMLAENLLMPHFPISNLEAMGRRLRRNYLWIYAVVGLSWLAKLYLFPTPATSWTEFILRARVGPFSGGWVLAAVLLFLTTLVVIAIATIGLRRCSGEVLPRFEGLTDDSGLTLTEEARQGVPSRSWFRPKGHRRKQLMTLIVTDHPRKISEAITQDLNRGATEISARGSFTGKERTIMMVALTVTEVAQLKGLVARADPAAFVIVTPVHRVFGKGFGTLENEGRT